MARRKYPRTRFQELTFKEFEALPDAEKEAIHAEHVKTLRERGEYNENATETFFDTLNKAINPNK